MPKKKSQTAAAEKSDGDDHLPFEAAMERVETIVDAMESDSLQLEEMLVQYEEGARLLASCQATIDAAQQRIETIASERKTGAVTLKPFDGGESDMPSAEHEEEDPDKGSDDIRLF